MKVDISDLLGKRKKFVEFDYRLNPSEVEDGAVISDDIKLCEEVHVFGKVTDNDGYMSLRATVSVKYETVCDRCLAPLSDTLEFDFLRYAVAKSGDIEKLGIDEDDILSVNEASLDFDRDVLEAIALELPVYHLCADDCPGLCCACGKKLDGACKCTKEKEIDPRMESFQKILAKMKKE